MQIEHWVGAETCVATAATPLSNAQEEGLVSGLASREVALLLAILAAALPTENITGVQTHNPALSHVFNSVYGGLISTPRLQSCWPA